MSACGKFRSHHRVHADHDLFLFRHNGISILNLISYPILEILTDYCGTDIDNPLFWDLGQVRLVRKVEPNILMSADKLQYFLDRQVLVLRYVYVLDGVVVQVRLLSFHDVFQEVHRNIVYRITVK